MNTHAMHLEAAGKEPRPCETCGAVFAPKRRWARFCKPDCRNVWHQTMRPDRVREARELVRLALEGCDPTAWNPRARKLLGIKE